MSAEHDILEIRVLLFGHRTDLYLLLGMDEAGKFGGWIRRSVEAGTPALDVLLHTIAMGDIEGWEKGLPPNAAGRGYLKPVKLNRGAPPADEFIEAQGATGEN